MSAEDNLSAAMFGKHISFDRWHGKAFRIAQTPPGRATDPKTGKVLPDEPDRWSIVTPENHDAWNWSKAPEHLITNAKMRWNSIQSDPNAQYKMDQIRRSIVRGAKKGR